ncbi:MAG: hypothetical protein EFKGCFLK_02712 [Rhodocyclaceae bacterium]|nr:oligosaccharide flippase family protein [Zoogloeaceae bacterium]MBV6409089.1 hypothetical protein [Rhodocyclaceae bacterium]
MTVLQRVAGTVMSLTSMRIGTAALTFLLFWLVARWSGSEALGAYAVVMNVFLFVQQMPMLGLHLALIRDAAAEPQALAENRMAMTWIALTVAFLLAAFILLAVAPAYSPALRVPIWLVAAAMLPTAITGVAESVMLGQQRMRLVAAVCIAEGLLRTAATVALVLMDYGVTAWMAVFLCGRVLAAMAYALAGETAGVGLLRSFPKAALLRYLRMSPVFAGILLAAAAFSRLDFFVLPHLVSLGEIGLYASAAKLYEAGLMVSSILVSALFPLFSHVWAENRSGFSALVEQVLRLMMAFGIPAAALACLAAEPIMLLLFGKSYSAASAVLAWLVPAALIMAGNQVLSAAMLASGRQVNDLMCVAAGAVVLLAGLALLVPHVGIVGAAWAIMAAMLFQFVFRSLWFGRQESGRALLRPLAPPLVAALAMALTGLALYSYSRLAAAAAGLAAYMLAGWLFGIVRREELAYFSKGASRLARKQ